MHRINGDNILCTIKHEQSNIHPTNLILNIHTWGSKPIIIIFRGITIHEPAIFRVPSGYRELSHTSHGESTIEAGQEMPDLVKVAMDLWRSGLHACAFPRILEMSQIPMGWLMKKEGVEETPKNNRFL